MATATSNPPAKDNTVELYTAIGKKYQTAFDNVEAQLRSVHWLIDNLPKGAAIVDLGCGTGKPVCSTLAAGGLDVTGVDITPEMVSVAASQFPAAKFEVGDARTWKPPGGPGSQDAMCLYFSLLTGVTQADIRAFFKSSYAALRPGGLLLYATVPYEREKVPIRWMGQNCVVSCLTAEETFKGLREAGFEIVKHEEADFLPLSEKAGLCPQEETHVETHLFVYCRKPE